MAVGSRHTEIIGRCWVVVMVFAQSTANGGGLKSGNRDVANAPTAPSYRSFAQILRTSTAPPQPDRV